MRSPRIKLLPTETGMVHKYWKCHNSSFYLQLPVLKGLYLRHAIEALKHKSCIENIELKAFSVMGNHVHMVLEYKNGSENLSNYMRIAHSSFGRAFNKQNRRTGKVANERPKTPLIQNDKESKYLHAMRVHFYVEANPLRARKVKTLEALRKIKHNSYSFYAHGEKNEFTQHITEPDWYLELASTPEERQEKYRQLFDQYLAEFGVVKKNKDSLSKKQLFALFLKETSTNHSKLIGSPKWKITVLSKILKIDPDIDKPIA